MKKFDKLDSFFIVSFGVSSFTAQAGLTQSFVYSKSRMLLANKTGWIRNPFSAKWRYESDSVTTCGHYVPIAYVQSDIFVSLFFSQVRETLLINESVTNRLLAKSKQSYLTHAHRKKSCLNIPIFSPRDRESSFFKAIAFTKNLLLIGERNFFIYSLKKEKYLN